SNIMSDTHTVKVKITNETTNNILSYFVFHTNNENKNLFISEEILDKGSNVNEKQDLKHSTGGGKDDSHWVIMWIEDNGKMFITSPSSNNFRPIMDLLKKHSGKLSELKENSKSKLAPYVTPATIITTALSISSVKSKEDEMVKHNLETSDDKSTIEVKLLKIDEKRKAEIINHGGSKHIEVNELTY
ncbi:hypothetical protein, partial [Photorhabdus laumondii]